MGRGSICILKKACKSMEHIIFVSVYERRVSVLITYCDDVIASLRFNDIVEIKKREDFLILDVLPNREIIIENNAFYSILEVEDKER